MDAKLQTRRGVAKTLTLDHDAVQLLEEMAAGYRHQGRFICELIRQEKTRREERERVRRALQEALP